jgi:hypothetical protein
MADENSKRPRPLTLSFEGEIPMFFTHLLLKD